MKYIDHHDKLYVDVVETGDMNLGLPLICKAGNVSEYPNDFQFIVFAGDKELKAKFIYIEDAKEYAAFLYDKQR